MVCLGIGRAAHVGMGEHDRVPSLSLAAAAQTFPDNACIMLLSLPLSISVTCQGDVGVLMSPE